MTNKMSSTNSSQADIDQQTLILLKRAYDEGIRSGEGRKINAKTLLTELSAAHRKCS